ncbi:MAG: NADH-quinone oxidoreductase subunit B [Bacillota bacterium]
MAIDNEKELMSQEELESKGILLTSLDKVLNWARGWSLWPFQFGLACCAIEMICTTQARFDISRFGYEVFRNSPRQADVMIVAGTVSEKMRPSVERLYHQMAEPRWVIAMGNCAISGGPFVDSYAVVPGADEIVPVDVFIPGCPPRPEALIHGMLQLKEKLNSPAKVRLKKHGK